MQYIGQLATCRWRSSPHSSWADSVSHCADLANSVISAQMLTLCPATRLLWTGESEPLQPVNWMTRLIRSHRILIWSPGKTKRLQKSHNKPKQLLPAHLRYRNRRDPQVKVWPPLRQPAPRLPLAYKASSNSQLLVYRICSDATRLVRPQMVRRRILVWLRLRLKMQSLQSRCRQ